MGISVTDASGIIKRTASLPSSGLFTACGWAYLTAYRNVYGRNAETARELRRLIVQFEGVLTEFGLGSVAEIFDAEAPHLPSGCFSQAWSVAELLRVIHEELDGQL